METGFAWWYITRPEFSNDRTEIKAPIADDELLDKEFPQATVSIYQR